MADINRYSTATDLALSDLLPVWSGANGDTRKASLSQVKALLLPADSTFATQYAAPNAKGFTATVAPPDNVNAWLVLTPAAGYAAGTVVLPAASDSVHGQEVQVTCTQSVATLTVTSSGSTVAGAPASLAANGFFKMKFEAVTSTWYRVG